MSIYAIGDLHLPGGCEKPMDVFGSNWDKHFETISLNWRRMVSEGDTVLIPGDISWAMQLDGAMQDIERIDELPGEKVLLRGNHDYWWSSITKLRRRLPPDMRALQNDALMVPGAVVCGTRGWLSPGSQTPLDGENEKVYQRELIRLRMSLECADRLRGAGTPLIAMLHFPPLLAGGAETGFSRLLEEFGADIAVYGHLHGAGVKNGFEGDMNGVTYHLTSCDALDFSPKLILRAF